MIDRHVVQWSGCFRGTEADPRETGWCETCGREVYDGDSGSHRREPYLCGHAANDLGHATEDSYCGCWEEGFDAGEEQGRRETIEAIVRWLRVMAAGIDDRHSIAAFARRQAFEHAAERIEAGEPWGERKL
jgi:hypothetical protein